MENTEMQKQRERAVAPETLLSPSSWLNNINFINHLILFNNILTALIAEKGAGKTSFSKILPRHLDSAITCHCITASASFSPHQMLSDLSEFFHCSLVSRFDLASLVKSVNERQQHVLLLIDDAHHLDDAFIKDILNVIKQQPRPAYFHFLLVSDYSILPSLNELSANDYKNIIHTMEIGPLSQTELSTYLKIKTRDIAGLKGLDDKRKLQEFYQKTDGMIAEVNSRTIHFFASEQGRGTGKSRMRQISKIAASFAIVAAAATYFANNSHDVLDRGSKLVQQYIPAAGRFLPDGTAPVLTVQKEVPSFMPPLQLADTFQSGPVMASRITPVELPLVTATPASQLVQIPLYNKSSITALPSVQQQDLKPSAVSALIYTTPKVSHKIGTGPTKPPKAVKTAMVSELAKIPVPKVEPKQTAKLKKTKKSPPRYRIQVAASLDSKPLENMIKYYAANLNAHIYKTLVKDKIWYVLTVGEYSQWKEADTAIKKLPKRLTANKPWIRPVGTLAKAQEYHP